MISALQLKDEDFQQIHPMDSHQPPLSERIKICLLVPIIVFIVIKLLVICIRLIIRLIIISVLIISCTTIRIMPVIDSTRLLSSRPRTANRIILDIMYEIVLVKCILFLFIFSMVTISFLFAHLRFKVFKKDIINY